MSAQLKDLSYFSTFLHRMLEILAKDCVLVEMNYAQTHVTVLAIIVILASRMKSDSIVLKVSSCNFCTHIKSYSTCLHLHSTMPSSYFANYTTL